MLLSSSDHQFSEYDSRAIQSLQTTCPWWEDFFKKSLFFIYPFPEKLKMSINRDSGTQDEKRLKVQSESLQGTVHPDLVTTSGLQKL